MSYQFTTRTIPAENKHRLLEHCDIGCEDNPLPVTGTDRTTFLDSLRAITIVMVVAIHATAGVKLTPSVASVVHFIVATIAVPSFFLCDGYLLVLRGAARLRAGYIDYVGRSAKRLLVPWLVFSVFYTVVRAVFEWAGVLDQHVVVGRPFWQVLVEVYSSGIAPQMYFLVSLFLIRTGGFAFRRLAEGSPAVPWAFFVVYALLYRLVWADPLKEFFSTGLDPVLHAAWGMQFYLLGIALARLGTLSAGRAGALSAIAWAILGASVCLGLEDAWPGVVQYAYLVGVVFAFAALGERGALLARFGRDSMGVYLLHAPILLRAVAVSFAMVVHSPFILYLCICVSTTGLAWLGARLLGAHPAGRWILGTPARGRGAEPVTAAEVLYRGHGT